MIGDIDDLAVVNQRSHSEAGFNYVGSHPSHHSTGATSDEDIEAFAALTVLFIVNSCGSCACYCADNCAADCHLVLIWQDWVAHPDNTTNIRPWYLVHECSIGQREANPRIAGGAKPPNEGGPCPGLDLYRGSELKSLNFAPIVSLSNQL